MTIRTCDFLIKYEKSCRAVCDFIAKIDPDYLIALSRKGTRLIKLLRQFGFFKISGCIITEKAIDFIPRDDLDGKKIVIFDDVIVLGSTINDLIIKILNLCDVNLSIVCIAIDSETTVLENQPDGKYYFTPTLANGTQIEIEANIFKIISREERYTFCHDVVKALHVLNVPFDVDFPIFEFKLTQNEKSKLLLENKYFQPIELTTINQFRNKFMRFSLIASQSETINSLFKDIISAETFCLQLKKIRVYYDSDRDITTLAPMVVFSLGLRDLKGDTKIFAPEFDFINKLLIEIKKILRVPREKDKNSLIPSPEECLFRVCHYFINFIFGVISLNSIFYQDGTSLNQNYNDKLDSEDIIQLFGPSLYEKIVKVANLICKNTTIKYSEKIGPISKTESIIDVPVIWDDKQKKMYTDAHDYIEERCKKSDSLFEQLSSIFEGMYIYCEIPAQEYYKEHQLVRGAQSRLNVGLNIPQIKSILVEQNKNWENKFPIEKNQELSLATDYLVDLGVQIPCFYYNESEKIFERVYRYGEDWYCNLRYKYLVAGTIRALFEKIQRESAKPIQAIWIPKILMEKMCLLTFYYQIKREGLENRLKEPVEGYEFHKIEVKPGAGLHGSTLETYDEQLDRQSRYFISMCRKEGMIAYGKGKTGVKFDKRFFNLWARRMKNAPRLATKKEIDDLLETFECLYSIDRTLDFKNEYRYATAIVSVAKIESYLIAIRELIFRFFDYERYRVRPIINALKNTLKDVREIEQINQSKLSLGIAQNKYTRTVIESFLKKMEWRKNFPKIIDEIQKGLEDCDPSLQKSYYGKIKPLEDWMHYSVDLLPPIRGMKDNLENIGRICIQIYNILNHILNILRNINNPQKIETFLKNIQEELAKWQINIQDNIWEVKLTPINYEKQGIEGIKNILIQIESNYQIIAKYVFSTLSDENWAEWFNTHFDTPKDSATKMVISDEEKKDIDDYLQRQPGTVNLWLKNFLPNERNYAWRLLSDKGFCFIDNQKLRDYLKDLYTIILERYGPFEKIIFVPIGGVAKSDDLIGYMFREINQIPDAKYYDPFDNKLNAMTGKTIVYIDDLSGSGKQFCDDFDAFKTKLNPDFFDKNKFVFAPIFISEDAISIIREKTKVQLCQRDEFCLTRRDCTLDKAAGLFSEQELPQVKDIFEKYGKILYPKAPLGYGGFAFRIAFFYNTPNNTLPIFWGKKKPTQGVWNQLFPRNESRKLCDNCGAAVPKGSLKCSNCQSTL